MIKTKYAIAILAGLVLLFTRGLFTPPNQTCRHREPWCSIRSNNRTPESDAASSGSHSDWIVHLARRNLVNHCASSQDLSLISYFPVTFRDHYRKHRPVPITKYFSEMDYTPAWSASGLLPSRCATHTRHVRRMQRPHGWPALLEGKITGVALAVELFVFVPVGRWRWLQTRSLETE
jgi:hypothetical protein